MSVSRGIHGVGIEGLSIGGFDDLEKETAAHKVLLGAKKLIIEDICIPEAMLDGRIRHFAAFPVLIRELAEHGLGLSPGMKGRWHDLDSDDRTGTECGS